MVSDSVSVFHNLSILCGKTFSLVPGSRSSAKLRVISCGHVFFVNKEKEKLFHWP